MQSSAPVVGAGEGLLPLLIADGDVGAEPSVTYPAEVSKPQPPSAVPIPYLRAAKLAEEGRIDVM